jgi:hypothetical protein
MRIRSLALAATMLAAVSTAASGAAVGKPGLWQVTATVKMPGMTAHIPPEQLAMMKARGIHVPDANGTTITTTHCMTPEEVRMDKMPAMGGRSAEYQKYCQMKNMKSDGSGISVDMECNNENMTGTGHSQVSWDSPEHYAGKYSFTGTARGRPMAMSMSFDAKWLQAACPAH